MWPGKNLISKGMKILIVEDEPKVVSFLQEGLRGQGFTVEIAPDGETGESMFRSHYYDLVLLDIVLPDISGKELCRIIRQTNRNVPILMLTALTSLQNKLDSFNSGADDYLVKPFEFQELLARINALRKRSGLERTSINCLKSGDIILDLDKKVVKRENKTTSLSSREFALLELLMRNKGKVLSRNEIAERVWDVTFDTGTNIVDVYINMLRKKIDKDYPVKYIHTRIGMGYSFGEE
jgi:two-component system, OmpR family, copper resistance phosphate regulon response regulator CusR